LCWLEVEDEGRPQDLDRMAAKAECGENPKHAYVVDMQGRAHLVFKGIH